MCLQFNLKFWGTFLTDLWCGCVLKLNGEKFFAAQIRVRVPNSPEKWVTVVRRGIRGVSTILLLNCVIVTSFHMFDMLLKRFELDCFNALN